MGNSPSMLTTMQASSSASSSAAPTVRWEAITPYPNLAMQQTWREKVMHCFKLWIRTLLWVAGLQRDKLRLKRLFVGLRSQRGIRNTLVWFCWNLAQTTFRLVRLLAAPEVFGRYFLATVTLHITYEVYTTTYSYLRKLLIMFTPYGRKIERLKRTLRLANNFQEYQAVAQVLDEVEGHDKWRQDPVSDQYEHVRVQKKIKLHKKLQMENDIAGLMFHLRAGLLRKHWGFGNPRLYSVSHVGTKQLIIDYIDTVTRSMDAILEDDSHNVEDGLSMDNKLAFFNETRHSFGRSALLLSGGAAMGIYHAGVIKALYEEKVLPTVLSGASAGSIVAAIIGVRTDDELADAFKENGLNLTFFGTNIDEQKFRDWKPSIMRVSSSAIMDSISRMCYLVHRWTEQKYVLDTNVLKACLQENLGDLTFREAYDRTGRIINITVTPTGKADYPQLLNYLTAPNVVIWSACLASCAIPLVFSPVELVSKDKTGEFTSYSPEGLKWSDGSVEMDLPMQRLSELFNVNHFIVSQANLHYKLLSGYDMFGGGRLTDLILFFKNQMKAYIKNLAAFGLHSQVFRFLGFGLVPFLTQRYEGDITITPYEGKNTPELLIALLKNPTQEDFKDILKTSERATWKHIPRIRTMCQVEFKLETAVRQIRAILALTDITQKGSLGRVPSFYTSYSNQNLANMWSRHETTTGIPVRSMMNHATIVNPTSMKRNKSINVAGAVMTNTSQWNFRRSGSSQ